MASAVACSFFERLGEIPIYAHSTETLTNSYRKLKEKHTCVGYFIDGGIYGLKSLAIVVPVTDVILAKAGIPKLKEIGCKSLDKIEAYLPIVKKEPNQMSAEAFNYILSKISAIPNKDNLLPKTCAEAITALIASLFGIMADSKVGQPALSILDEGIYAVEGISDRYFYHGTEFRVHDCRSKKGIRNKLYCLAEKNAKRYKTFALHESVKHRDRSLSNLELSLLFVDDGMNRMYEKSRILPLDAAPTKTHKYLTLLWSGTVITLAEASLASLPYLKHLYNILGRVHSYCLEISSPVVKMSADFVEKLMMLVKEAISSLSLKCEQHKFVDIKPLCSGSDKTKEETTILASVSQENKEVDGLPEIKDNGLNNVDETVEQTSQEPVQPAEEQSCSKEDCEVGATARSENPEKEGSAISSLAFDEQSDNASLGEENESTKSDASKTSKKWLPW